MARLLKTDCFSSSRFAKSTFSRSIRAPSFFRRKKFMLRFISSLSALSLNDFPYIDYPGSNRRYLSAGGDLCKLIEDFAVVLLDIGGIDEEEEIVGVEHGLAQPGQQRLVARRVEHALAVLYALQPSFVQFHASIMWMADVLLPVAFGPDVRFHVSRSHHFLFSNECV